MAVRQGFPQLDSRVLDSNGNLSLTWLQFFTSLWQRTGSAPGNNSATFNYPDTNGNPNQVLTSAGSGNPAIWTNLLSKLSQFANDAGFITNAALAGLQSVAGAANQIAAYVGSQLSISIPAPDSTIGAVGILASLARADHSHPREVNPTFLGTVTASKLATGTATWTSGAGAPTSTQPNGSIYSNLSGATGSRLYVSNGTTWTAVPGV